MFVRLYNACKLGQPERFLHMHMYKSLMPTGLAGVQTNDKARRA